MVELTLKAESVEILKKYYWKFASPINISAMKVFEVTLWKSVDDRSTRCEQMK